MRFIVRIDGGGMRGSVDTDKMDIAEKLQRAIANIVGENTEVVALDVRNNSIYEGEAWLSPPECG
jgi:hypothetical protein